MTFNSHIQSNASKDIVEIVPMCSADIAEIKELEIQSNLSTWSVEDYKNELERNDSLALVAKSSNKVVGFFIARLITNKTSSNSLINKGKLKGEAEIYNIGINKKHRRKGIGKSFLNQLFELSKIKSVESIWLDVRESNDTAISFYVNQGFEIAYTRKNFYRLPMENAIVMIFRII